MAYKPQILEVAAGGTGQSTLLIHGVLVGNSTSGITALAVGANNSIFMGNTGADPAFTTSGTPYVTGISFDAGGNILSNYSLSTFSPTITNTGTAPTLTYTSQNGRYTRIGNRVITQVRVVLNTYAAGTGNTQISGLPITSNNTANNNSIAPITLQTVTYGASVLWYCANLAPNATVVDIEGYRSTTTALNLVAAGPAAGAILGFTMVYEV